MKNLILAFALVGVVAACNTEKKSVADDSGANMPKAGCCEGKAACDGTMKAECSEMKKECSTPCSAKPQG